MDIIIGGTVYLLFAFIVILSYFEVIEKWQIKFRDFVRRTLRK